MNILSSPLRSTLSWPKVACASVLVAGLIAGGTIGYLHVFHPSTPASKPQVSVGTQTSQNALTSLNTQTARVTSTPSVDPYAQWKAISRGKYSLKVPSSWYSANDLGSTPVNDMQSDFATEKVEAPAQTSDNGIYCSLTQLPTVYPEDPFAIAFASPVGQFTVDQLGNAGVVWTKEANLTIAGYQAAEYTSDSSAVTAQGQNYSINIGIKKSGTYYSLICGLNKNKVHVYLPEINLIAQSLSFK